ncbi:MAG TPA: carboxypeptidase-like regulatory domain-containing protein [Candidatus Acidoferrales bacterium]
MENIVRKVFAALVVTLTALLMIVAPAAHSNATSQDAPANVLLQGAVTDSSGAALTDAQLIVHWDSSGSKTGLASNVGIPEDRFLKTDTHGNFYAEIPPGFYDVLVAAPGFTPDCRKIRLKPGENQTLNSKLQIDPQVAAELARPSK